MQTNDLGQPVGVPVPEFHAARRPELVTLQGRFCRLEKLQPGRHSEDLYAALRADESGALWTYLLESKPRNLRELSAWVERVSGQPDPAYYALIDRSSGRCIGRAAYLRIEPEAGSIEVGSILYSPALQRTLMATEVMYLMMQHAFDELGYRRYEWKCDSLNEPSRRAAERLGFTYEGTFRQALVYKGRNRDTAWYAIIDKDWPQIRKGYQAWFDPANFDETGQQKHALATFIAAAREAGES